jgi:hypothetical protein
MWPSTIATTPGIAQHQKKSPVTREATARPLTRVVDAEGPEPG